MSGHQYITNPDNIFEDDIDDETFLANSRQSSSPLEVQSTNPFEQQRRIYEQKRRAIEERTLGSTDRSLGLLYETEEVGKATAAELAKQREQLEKSNRQLDEINATLRFSQKHLNGLKSVFGSLKNYIQGKSDMPISNRTASSPTESKVSESGSSHAFQQQTNSPSYDDRYMNHPVNRLRSDLTENKRPQSTRNAFEERLGNNLDEMSNSISRLKGLATNMHDEIESQNDLLDNMNYKIEDVDIKIEKQNKQINSLLGKK
ncbi:synaptosomal-associated protein 29 [Condylostylus longicornis]|uniref:synaptosomal-associated protein 29 n=1 Tax=Condylostylus longicornis TaxID=2530218 RepID=UPI00244DEA49|nr:synaptosomal-associated protein 29 [Condylostylus longicornis]